MGVVAGAAASGGCAVPSLNSGRAMAATGGSGVLNAVLQQLDASMDAVAESMPLHDLFAASQAKLATRPDAEPSNGDDSYGEGTRRLMQKSLRSLLVTGAFHNLPKEEREAPAFQQRVMTAGSEMDDAVFGTAQLLDGMSRGDLVELRRKLRRDPSMPERVAETLNQKAKEIGVPIEQRLRLRKLAKHVVWRMEKQPVDALFGEYVGKVRKLAARHGYDEALQRHVAARATTNALLAWGPALSASPLAANPQAAAPGGSPTAPPSATAPPPPAPGPGTGPPPAGGPPPAAGPNRQPPGYGPPPQGYGPRPASGQYRLPPETRRRPEPERTCVSESESKRGKTAITVGSILLGVGGLASIVGTTAVTTGGGFLGSTIGLFTLTAAGLLLLAGLITIIIGGAQATSRLEGPVCRTW